jgi:glycosyltransferase involved in cell wall biosynthesis
MTWDYSKEPGRHLKKDPLSEFQGVSPLISIITPYYNAGTYFEQTYNCVINQTFPWFEWIIINDGSNVEKDINQLDTLASTDCRIKYFCQINSGAAKARKNGIYKSLSEIIIFLDSDDLIENTFIEYLYWALIKNSDASWAYTDSVGFADQEYPWQKDFSSSVMKKTNILPYAAAIRKSIFMDDMSIYPDETKNLWEDWQLWLRMLAKGMRPVHIKQPLFWYRRHKTGELERINNNNNTKLLLNEKIKQLAKSVPNGITAFEFPIKEKREFITPGKFDFNFDEFAIRKNKNKINILLLLPHVVKGGADKFNLDIARHIDKNKYEINVILTTFNENDEWFQELSENCDSIFVLKNFLSLYDWNGFIHYYIKTRSIDIVWNISSFYGYYISPWLRKEFANLALADYVHADAAYWRNGGYARLSSALQEILDCTVTTNHVTLDIMAKKYGNRKKNCHVSYIGTDADYFNPNVVPFGTVRDMFGIKKESPMVLFLCRISQEKRPFLMLKIAEKLVEKISDIIFLVVGDGDKRSELEAKCEKAGLKKNVLFVGSHEDIRPFYRDSDVFLICSIKEGLASTTFEAMSMGLPIISADVGGQSEIVNEHTGRLIPCLQKEEDYLSTEYNPLEIQNYVDVLYELLTNLPMCKMVGKNNRMLVENKYTILDCVRRFEEYSLNLIESSDCLESRKNIRETLLTIPHLCDEILTLYSSYEKLEQTAKDFWEANQWLRKLLNNKNVFLIQNRKYQDLVYWFLHKTLVGTLCLPILRKIYHYAHDKLKRGSTF